MNKTICAIVVSYNPDEVLLDNLKALLLQVDKVIVVDNNSQIDMAHFFTFFTDNNIAVIKNNENKGIATALNQGYEFAKNCNYKYLITMDQDSVLDKEAVNIMYNVLQKNPDIGSVGVNYKNKKSDNEIEYTDAIITSGNLTSLEIIEKVGGYCDEYFIDSVDFDFSLSIRNLGYKLAIAKHAYMKHSIGQRKVVKILNKEICIVEHSPLRYYYISKNHKLLVNKYKNHFPIFCLKKSIFYNLHKIEMFFLHSNKKEKFEMMKTGKEDARLIIKQGKKR